MADLDRITELVGNKDYEVAKPLIEEGLKEEPNNVELIKLAGLAEVNLCCWNSAKNYFETVVKFVQDDATAWFYLANCYNNLADFISAKNAYKKVIELRPEYIEAHKSLCVILLKLNEIDETIKYAIETTGTTEGVEFQGHDFSMRGMSSLESAKSSGAGHLLSFTGTDL